jgi:hypothetical protein
MIVDDYDEDGNDTAMTTMDLSGHNELFFYQRVAW